MAEGKKQQKATKFNKKRNFAPKSGKKRDTKPKNTTLGDALREALAGQDKSI